MQNNSIFSKVISTYEMYLLLLTCFVAVLSNADEIAIYNFSYIGGKDLRTLTILAIIFSDDINNINFYRHTKYTKVSKYYQIFNPRIFRQFLR